MSLAAHSVKILAMAVALAGLHAVVPMMAGQPAPALGSCGWEVLVLFIMGATLAVAVARSSLHGWRLIGGLFLLAAGVSALLVAFEALVFVGPFAGFTQAVIWWVCRAGAMSVALVIILGKMRPSEEGAYDVGSRTRWSIAGWLWRIAVAVAAYTVLFMVAGLLIMRLEAVPDYTSTQTTPVPIETRAPEPESDTQPAGEASKVRVPPLGIILMFIWVRGLACIAFTLPLIRGLSGGRWTAALVVGLALPVMAGVVPLLPPNPDMTTAARFAHMLEIGWSNFAYGLFIGYLFGRRT